MTLNDHDLLFHCKFWFACHCEIFGALIQRRRQQGAVVIPRTETRTNNFISLSLTLFTHIYRIIHRQRLGIGLFIVQQNVRSVQHLHNV